MDRILSTFFVIIFFSIAYSQGAAATIAIVKTEDIKPYELAIEGFKKACRANYFEYSIESDINKGHQIATELKVKRPDAILVLGAKAAYVISQDIKDIPIIFCMVTDHEKYDLIGENVAGVEYRIPIETQIKIFTEMFPGLKRLGIIYSSADTLKFIEEVKGTAVKYSIEIESIQIKSKDEIPDAVSHLLTKIDLLWLIYDANITESEKVIIDTIILPSLQRKIPIAGFNKWSVTMGALMCIFSDYGNMGQEAGAIANRILQGYQPSLIGIKSPERVNILVNSTVLRRIKEKMQVLILDNTYMYEG